ncbi:D-methionine transport system substrate-binding protein [Gracilibacillus ureilyticus]|uniref:Lipoprotein n=1 Tax=Gracilibacillus ureilyticus TaxID=531814 RepID=A0A1H9QBC6_9BACI|nr:MetQ/NlpA family ABC transporter substrate-binding protein [Gracilibacillus ureilyticus]SER57189.1 D-methionine transport system substrate-binding protein [Gracilibacillus ureilyticus]
MKKYLVFLLTALLLTVLAACGTTDNEEEAENSNTENETEETAEENNEEEASTEKETIVVGASSVPHAEILEEAVPLLEEEGIELQIETYQDYVFPNDDLENGTLDANYFQHIPYLETQMEEKGFDFVNLGGIHFEPMGIYSKNIENLEDVQEGTVVIMSNSVSDHGRVLALLESEGLIKLDENVDIVDATVNDVVENPLNLEFDTDIDAGFLPEFYEREADSLVAINTNYAIEAGLTPSEDSLVIEGSDTPYVNVIAARSEDENNEALQKLVEVLRSEEIQNFINEKYEGAVVPVSE